MKKNPYLDQLQRSINDHNKNIEKYEEVLNKTDYMINKGNQLGVFDTIYNYAGFPGYNYKPGGQLQIGLYKQQFTSLDEMAKSQKEVDRLEGEYEKELSRMEKEQEVLEASMIKNIKTS